MPTIETDGLVTSPRHRARRKYPVTLTVEQIGELLGMSRFAAYRFVRAHEKKSGLALIQAGAGGKIYVALSAFKAVFSDLWESHLDSQAMQDAAHQ